MTKLPEDADQTPSEVWIVPVVVLIGAVFVIGPAVYWWWKVLWVPILFGE